MNAQIARFKQYLIYEKGLSPKSVEAYLHDALLLEDFLGDKKMEDATFEDLQQFLKHLYQSDYNARSQARIISGMRAFYRYLIYANVLETDPTELLDAPKIGMHLPDVLTVEEIQRIMEVIDLSTPEGHRNRAMAEVMYGCGLRVSELCAMKTEDIIADGELLRVIGKGSKERIVPIGSAAGRALVAYLASARDVFTKGDLSIGHVFVTRLKKPFTRQAVFKLIRERALAAGIAPERISPHVLRHCFASHMLQHGADIRAIQELLGHADIGTTQIYTHVDATRFGDIHRRFHPRG